MPAQASPIHLPDYQTFVDTIAVLALPISASELHGILCGYLCAGAVKEGETYLRALNVNNKEASRRDAVCELFAIYSVSHHQLINFDFEFQLLLPEGYEPLINRARALSEWCEGFIQSMTTSGMGYKQLQEEESQDALQHLHDFAELDYESLEIDNEEDEKALVEVSEYTRLAVVRIYEDLRSSHIGHGSTTTH